MIGLISIIAVGGLFLLACGAFTWTYRARRRKGQSQRAAFVWAMAAVALLSLPITWDAIPTWIAFEHYSRNEAGVKILKTLEQWKAENPGVAETLEPYRLRDKRANVTRLANGKLRYPLNDRFAYDTWKRDQLFLSVYANSYEVIDRKSGEVLMRYVEVGSGNPGGLASGGERWWAFWLIHQPTEGGREAYSRYRDSAENIRVSK
jgi:hypothetical protein